MEGYISDLCPKMKQLELYLLATYSEICQPAIMTKNPATFPDPEMLTFNDSGIKRPKTDADMTYLEKNNIDEAIKKKLRKKDVYESEMEKI